MGIQGSVNAIAGSVQQAVALNKFYKNQEKEMKLKSAESEYASQEAYINERAAEEEAKVVQKLKDIEKLEYAGTQLRDSKGRYLTREKSIEKMEHAKTIAHLERQAAIYAKEQTLAHMRGDFELEKSAIQDPGYKWGAKQADKERKQFEKEEKQRGEGDK